MNRETKLKETYNKNIKIERQKLKEGMPLIKELDEDEIIFYYIVYANPTVLKYIINYNNLDNELPTYPSSAELAATKYLIQRKNNDFLTYPEILILLNKLGFNMELSGTYAIGMQLTSKLNDQEGLFNTSSLEKYTDEMKKSIQEAYHKNFHSDLWKQIITSKNIQNILTDIYMYILNHPEKFIREETLTTEPKL